MSRRRRRRRRGGGLFTRGNEWPNELPGKNRPTRTDDTCRGIKRSGIGGRPGGFPVLLEECENARGKYTYLFIYLFIYFSKSPTGQPIERRSHSLKQRLQRKHSLNIITHCAWSRTDVVRINNLHYGVTTVRLWLPLSVRDWLSKQSICKYL